MKDIEVKIEEESPFTVDIYVDGLHVAWQPFEPGSLLPWSSKDDAKKWADDWLQRSGLLAQQPEQANS